jgi:endogenous inhibitor of DNA gyrase (YacG/DUF329 family)
MYIEKKACKHCRKEFHLTSNTRGQFCSKRCYHDFRQANPGYYRKTEHVHLTCAICGKEFTRRQCEIKSENTYCSPACAGKRKRGPISARNYNKITKPCEECGRDFTMSHRDGLKRRFCSKSCEQAYRSKYMRGENNPNYRHGKNRVAAKWTALRWYPASCALCGFGVAIQIHHIRPIATDGTNEVGNLIVLCPNHHAMAELKMFTDEELKSAAALVKFEVANTGKP